jgi:hypothetical protein
LPRALQHCLATSDFAQSSAALLGDISAMDYIPFFSSVSAQVWQAYLTARSIYLQESSSIGGYVRQSTWSCCRSAWRRPFQAPYFTLRGGSSNPLLACNLLFSGLFDLIIGHMTQMGLMIPNGGNCRNLDAIFEYKLSKLNENERDRHLLGAEIISFPNWLIYICADRLAYFSTRIGGPQFAVARRR